jgi:biotin carboxyl carrier protein
VLIQLLFPQIAPDYLRGPEPADKAATRAPAPRVATEPAAEPATPPPPPAPPPASAAVSAEFDVEVEGEVFKVRVSGAGMTVVPGLATSAASAAPGLPRAGEGTVIAPMQGLIVKIPVKPGDEVKLGDVVAVLEAMKMQNDIVTTIAGRVLEVYVKEGEVVTPSQPLLAVG